MYRDHTKVIQIGNRVIGGGNPIGKVQKGNQQTPDTLHSAIAEHYKA